MDKQMRAMILTGGVIAVLLVPLAVQAQSEREQELERRLQERDKVILELLQRVEALERRVGIESFEQKTDSGSPEISGAELSSGKGEVAEGTGKKEPGTVVVEEGAAERALERALTRQGALLLNKGFFEIEPSLSFARAEDSTPYLFTSGGQLFVGNSERNSNTLTADVAFRLGLPWDAQLEAGVPYRWREIETVNSVDFSTVGTTTLSAAALGDVRLGLAKTLLREGVGRPDLIARITWDSDTGDIFEDGVALGGGFNELRGSLTAIKRQDPLVFVTGLAYEYSFEEDEIQPGSTYSANLGSFIALSPETSLSFVLTGAYQEETELSGIEIDGSDQTVASLVIGGSTLVAPGTLLNVSAGIGLTDDADDFTLSVSLPIRFGQSLY